LAGLAFLKTYRDDLGADVFFIGCPGGVEQRLVPAEGVRLLLVPGEPFARQGLPRRAAAIVGMLRGALAARKLLRNESVDLVIGVGGYASVGAGLAAWSLGIPLVIHEANAHPGLANLMLARVARRVCVGFAEASKRFKRSVPQVRVEFTGNPATVGPFTTGRRSADPACWRILVSAGSLGSPFLNREAPRMLAEMRALGCHFAVRHLAGTPHTAGLQTAGARLDEIRKVYREAGIEARVDPFTGSIGSAYAEADFVIGGAGALTLADIAAAGLPALLVPLASAANDHQSDNARAFCAHTGALWVEEANWNPSSIAREITELLGHPQRLEDIGRRALAFARPDAAAALVAVCEEVLGAGPAGQDVGTAAIAGNASKLGIGR